MNMRTLLLFLLSAVLAVAVAAERHTITLFQPSVVGETELEPGNYQLSLAGSHVVFRKGRKKVEADVRVETGKTKFKFTSVRYNTDGGKNRISEIRLGGTNRKLILH